MRVLLHRESIETLQDTEEVMGNWWEAFVIGAAASAIRTFVKNPKAAAQYQAVLQHVYDDLGQVLVAIGPAAPPAA